MFTIIVIFLVLLGINMPFWAGEDLSNNFEKAFADTAQSVDMRGKDWGHMRRQSLTPYEKVGSDLALRFPDADMEFLKAAATKKDGEPEKNLAWVVLAKLADRKEARDVILQHAVEGEQMAILAVSFMPEQARKEIAETVAVRGKAGKTIQDLIDLLGYIGDEGTVKVLDKIAKQDEEHPNRAAIEALERLKQAAAERDAWTRCGVLFWRATREVAIPASRFGKYYWVAELLSNSGVKFPVSFLRYYIKAGDPTAVILAGIQKESELVDDIDAFEESKNVIQYDYALESLMQIGNKAAIDALSKRMKPDNTEETNKIARLMGVCGTSEAVKLLERLLKDERYKESWPVFEEAIKRINERLKAQPPNGEPAPPANGEPASPPTDDSALTATDTGRPSGTPNATGTGTSSEGGAGGTVAETKPFPWVIVIVVAIAALALGAITTLLLTRAKKTAK